MLHAVKFSSLFPNTSICILVNMYPLLLRVIFGVEYCHSKIVVRRDLKLVHLMLDSEGNVKIIDFGLSNNMHG